MATHTFDNPGRIGRRVLYCLGEAEARDINWQRRQAGMTARNGNEAREGNIVPGVIVADWYQPLAADERVSLEDRQFRLDAASVNIQLFLDGNDSHWVTSRSMYFPKGVRNNSTGEYEPMDPKGHWIFAD